MCFVAHLAHSSFRAAHLHKALFRSQPSAAPSFGGLRWPPAASLRLLLPANLTHNAAGLAPSLPMRFSAPALGGARVVARPLILTYLRQAGTPRDY